ncbi:MAG: hypothetical protein NT080_12005 [Spirochaetes bacterium]|nr:hypothetical protein [Spirochaetota bacterium]
MKSFLLQNLRQKKNANKISNGLAKCGSCFKKAARVLEVDGGDQRNGEILDKRADSGWQAGERGEEGEEVFLP